jgi:osmotically-inducible protein OsmY
MDKIVSEIAERVSTALENDKRTQDLALEVIDSSGIVTLEGQVPSEKLRQVAAEIASRQEGVIEVVNELEVRPEKDEWVVMTAIPTDHMAG